MWRSDHVTVAFSATGMICWKRRSLAGKSSGERIWAFPSDPDYDVELESKIADIKQCTLEGEADHILAARFLSRFVGDLPWLHMDLSSQQ